MLGRLVVTEPPVIVGEVGAKAYRRVAEVSGLGGHIVEKHKERLIDEDEILRSRVAAPDGKARAAMERPEISCHSIG